MPDVLAASQRNPVQPARTGGSARSIAAIRARSLPAFTLVDLIVSISVIGILIALMLPSISGVRELTRRVICASNTRQIGLGIAMYAEDYKGDLPYSEYVAKYRAAAEPHNLIIVRPEEDATKWDGLGLLYASDYLNTGQVFYCPSHNGDHPFRKYAPKWAGNDGRIVVNYQYRGQNIGGTINDRTALLTDGLRTQEDYSHRVGSNVLRADFSLQWLADPAGVIFRNLPTALEQESEAASKVSSIWWTIDDAEGQVTASNLVLAKP